MASGKGPALEELVREYFSKQGYFALRSVPFRYEGEDVTDLDVWLYSRQAASARIRGLVDVKNKRSPKAFERVLWVKGLQNALSCDRAFVATTDGNPAVVRFASSQKISVLTKGFLNRLEKRLDTDNRLTLEAFVELINTNAAHKQDGNWVRVLEDAKSAVASLNGFSAFNRTMIAFRFFSERAEVRMQHKDIAIRCALFSAALACVALDGALERYVFEEAEGRYEGLEDGVMFGDSGDGRAKKSLEGALIAVSEGMENGRAIAAKAKDHLHKRLEALRADVIAEHFHRESNAQHLFLVAKELEEAAHSNKAMEGCELSLEARSILGVFADFAGIKRSVLPISKGEPGFAAVTSSLVKSVDEDVAVSQKAVAEGSQGKLL